MAMVTDRFSMLSYQRERERERGGGERREREGGREGEKE